MRKRGVTCLIVGGLVVVSVLACAVALFTGLERLAEVLPTPQPQPTFTVGETYWIGALLPVAPLPRSLVLRSADMYNKPGNINDPDVRIIGVLGEGTEVKLRGIRGEWCYVEGTSEFGRHIEGWLGCIRLLDYKPTPLPTPNLTPEQP